ncbi:MAG: DUF1846 domain-containing protein [Candidatus Faecousia sp.]|uniref:DUF1846 domain-containing protein n=1 Tax=Faecousia sp. TaxID=2952921 RepID=UPI002A8776BC|nr:DUF1846 domain-containing protein [Candidatus Faecousia sp.]
MKIGFDNEKYLTLQAEQIRRRRAQFGDKLYLEFGGKLFDDYHAARVLPGFQPDSKLRMLSTLRDEVELVIAIRAADIETSKLRGDLGISYGDEVLRLTDVFRELGFYVGSVVVTQYAGQPAADAFLARLTALGVKCYRHYPIAGYPSNPAHIVSEAGLGRNDYIETSRPIVVVTAPGPGSGKMATCLSQLYHEHRRGIRAGYAKYETFPIWNLPLKHPVNLAYEAATADLADVNMIDPFHLEAYGRTTVNYNRDVEIFPVLNAMFERIQGSSPYRSPTDMGVNMAGFAISDDTVCQEASRMEILRRYYAGLVDRAKGKCGDEVVRKLELVMQQAQVTPALCPAVQAALDRAAATGAPAGAMQLPDGRLVTGKTSSLLGPSAAMLLNAVKLLAGIDDGLNLLPPSIIAPISDMKTKHLGHRNPRLHSDEVLIALSISAVTNPLAERVLAQLDALRGSEAHFSVILSEEDANLYRRLGIHVSSEPKYEIPRLYHK